jgi:polyphosphate kinase
VPLLERVKFLAIFSSNLDEFFMKRVGLLKLRVMAAGRGGEDHPRGHHAGRLRHEIRERVEGLQTRQAAVWEGLLPALAEAGIRIRRHSDLTDEQRADIDQWFNANVFPILTPLAVDPSHRFPFISNLSENFGLLVSGRRDHRAGRSRGSRSRASSRGSSPERTGRTSARVPRARRPDRAQPRRLFPGLEIHEIAPFRVTRSAALDDEDDEDDENVMDTRAEDELRRRRFADACAIEAPEHASDDVLQFVVTQLGLDEDVYRGGARSSTRTCTRSRRCRAPTCARRPGVRSCRWTCGTSRRWRRCAAPGRGPAPGRFRHAHLDDLRAHPRGRHPAAPPLRVVRGTRSSGSSPRPRTTPTSSRSSRRSTARAPIRRSCAR